MKKILIVGCLFTILLATPFCKKNNPDEEVVKNSLSFQSNGQEWKPKGNNNTANLSLDYDPGIRKGIFGIAAYRIITDDNREYFGIGIRDSLNLMEAPFTIPFTNSGLCRIGFTNNDCELLSYDSDTFVDGSLKIVRLDRSKGIIEGQFSVSMAKAGCKSITITNGHFKMKL